MSHDTSLQQMPALARRLRILYFVAISLPIVLGTAIAWAHTGRLDVGLFALALVGSVLLQAGTTMTNDAFDLRYRGDAETDVAWLPQQVLQGAVAFFIVGIMVGVYITALTGPLVVVLGGVGILSALAYSVPPVRLAGTGLGELLAGFNLSAITALGSYYIQAGIVSREVLIAAVPGVCLLAGVLTINGFRPDKLLQRRLLWQRVGSSRAHLIYSLFAMPAYLWLIGALIGGALPIQATLGLLSLPLATAALVLAWQGALERAGQFAAYAYLVETILLTIAYLLV